MVWGSLINGFQIKLNSEETKMPAKILLIGGSGFIGSAIQDKLTLLKVNFLNSDLNSKVEPNQFEYIDLMDSQTISRCLSLYKPDMVINLASRTDDNGESVFDYPVNFLGLANLIHEIERFDRNTHLVHFSTQYVVAPKFSLPPTADARPYTTYGESKAIGELILQNSQLPNWTIVRPTAVWGEKHPSFPTGLWPLMKKRLVVQPKINVKRSYINVHTLVEQLIRIISLPKETINGKILYLGNIPIDPALLMDAFSIELTGRKLPRIPIPILKAILKISLFLRALGLKVPFDPLRFEIMTQNYFIDIEPTLKLIGSVEENLAERAKETIDWYKNQIK
jgi:nucleoside-diphosphate-sugar epimerase